ncbi:MAG: hypothetical protein K2K69_05760 [Muribaculaceae bacterium]|nr:hypothetical protein [Muribaculaceae bacterium]
MATDSGAVGLFSLVSLLPTVVYMTGPLVFAYCRRRSVVTTLPASWVEKGVLLVGYTLVVFPAFMTAVWYACTGLFAIFAPWADILTRTREIFSVLPGLDFTALTRSASWGNTFGYAWLASMTCYFVAAVRRQRLAIGIASIFGGYVATVIIGAVLGIYAVFSSGFIQAVKDGAVNPESPDAVVAQLLEEVRHLMPVYATLSAVLCVVFVVLTFWKIKTRQA